ncbi:hypothetical protein [Parasphingorhabdus halotolerans]|uniref:Uncharacterized protein n=1 Tax=Parasphingorhabdus halotolerans TaxID=2725558 RepID=A0A6H2DGT6_9SPHN|nr:hypothetical protein [Parasphingorhabdus halotolerans]QJB67882.1 hypothetical protein HF685_05735 [Parasphingorhabdus halotolerans]
MTLLRNLATAVVGNAARKRGKGNGIMGFGLGVIATRIATRSLPGAMLVGGAMIAKALYDRSRDEEELPASDQVIDVEPTPAKKKAKAP